MKVYVIGLGPGGMEQMTPRALQALHECDIVAGYDYYIELIAHLLQGKQVIATAMKREVERCNLAIEKALQGHTVGMVSSGDAGVYGMAGVMLECAAQHPELEIEIVPGITAACSASAVLGAPLIHDFAVISLSDLLTPWQSIEKRLECAAMGDFVVCLYNPSSKKRADYLQKACVALQKHQSPQTLCGYVRQIGRDGQATWTGTLAQLAQEQVDMFTTVVVGKSTTKLLNGRLVTPRGYTV